MQVPIASSTCHALGKSAGKPLLSFAGEGAACTHSVVSTAERGVQGRSELKSQLLYELTRHGDSTRILVGLKDPIESYK